jgi:hypothetical protein
MIKIMACRRDGRLRSWGKFVLFSEEYCAAAHLDSIFYFIFIKGGQHLSEWQLFFLYFYVRFRGVSLVQNIQLFYEWVGVEEGWS